MIAISQRFVQARCVAAATICALFLFCSFPALNPSVAAGQSAKFRVLAFYTDKSEFDHVAFARQAIDFFSKASKKDEFSFESTTNWDDLNAQRLKSVDVMLWLNDSPHSMQQRGAFEAFIKGGGAWLGFHASAYNDASTHWPWFVDFLGGTVFYANNWPPLPAKLTVEDTRNPATRRLPATFLAPANEWYIWKPSPRLDPRVKVLLALSLENYPLGLKDTIVGGDVPVAWTNTAYKMLYVNMGHGDKIFTNATQNQFFEDALLWLGTTNSPAPH
jgi:uncharacterized protein